MNARSRANLRPWPKGVSGNPSGKPKLPDELRAVRELTVEELRRLIGKFARMPAADVELLVDTKTATAMDVAIAATFKAAFSGSYGHLSFLLDRAVGKPKEAPDDEEEGEEEGVISLDEARKILAEDFASQPAQPVKVEDL